MLEARTQPGLQTASSLPKTSFLTSMSSNTASITRSTSREAVVALADLQRDGQQRVVLFLADLAALQRAGRLPAMRLLGGLRPPHRSFRSARRSTRPARRPLRCPPPSCRRRSRRWIAAHAARRPFSSGRLLTARSEKNAWIMPWRWSVFIRSMNNLALGLHAFVKGQLGRCLNRAHRLRRG